jgi:hypothetical protein
VPVQATRWNMEEEAWGEISCETVACSWSWNMAMAVSTPTEDTGDAGDAGDAGGERLEGKIIGCQCQWQYMQSAHAPVHLTFEGVDQRPTFSEAHRLALLCAHVQHHPTDAA